MKYSQKLTRQAREYIVEQMREKGAMSTDEAIEIVKPHLMLDPQALIRAETRRVVQQIMSSIKGETGKRACFNLKAEGDSQYINIETTSSVKALDGVEKQLDGQFYGLSESKKRIAKRRSVLICKRSKTSEEAQI